MTTIDLRRLHVRPGDVRDELLDVLIAAWRDGRIDDDELLGYIYGFVTAGSDTTGTSFANACSFALRAPSSSSAIASR